MSLPRLQICSPVAEIRIAFRNSSRLQPFNRKPRAPGDCSGNAGKIVEGGEQQHRQIRLVELDAVEDHQPVAIGHKNVQQHQIDILFQGQLDGSLTRRDFRHNLDFRAGQQGLYAKADHFLVVCNEKPDFAFSGHRKGLCIEKCRS